MMKQILNNNDYKSFENSQIQSGNSSFLETNAVNQKRDINLSDQLSENKNYQKIISNNDSSPKNQNSFSNMVKDIFKRAAQKEMVNNLRSRMYLKLTNFQLYLLNEPHKEKFIFQQSSKFDTNKFQNVLKNEKKQIPSKITQIWLNILQIFNRIFQCIQNFSQKCIHKIPVIQPNSILKLAWDIQIIINTVIMIIHMTLFLTFFGENINILSHEIESILVFTQVIDIILNFNAAYFSKGELIIDKTQIFKNYLYTEFPDDLVGVVPMLVFNLVKEYDSKFYFFVLISITRVLKFGVIMKKLGDIYNLDQTLKNLMKLIKLVAMILFISHMFACLWLFFAKMTSSYQQTWIDKYDLSDKQWYERYITAYYFSTVTMITVGYGDICPANQMEQILCIFTVLIACGVYGYSLNLIGIIIQDILQKAIEIDQKLETINKFMKKKKIKQQLQYEIREYLEYYWSNVADKDRSKEEEIIEQLSDNLKCKLLQDANKIIFSNNPVFQQFSQPLKDDILNIIQELKSPPEQIINSNIDEANIYFIEQGNVELYIQNKTIDNTKSFKIKNLQEGDHYGLLPFFTNQQSFQYIKTISFCSFLVIKRDLFKKILQKYPDDYQKFCQLKDQIKIYSMYNRSINTCVSCQKSTHIIENCPYIHHKKKEIYVVDKYCKVVQKNKQNRDSLYKRTKVKLKTLSYMPIIQEKALEYQEDFFHDIAPLYNIQHYYEFIEIDQDFYFQKKMIEEGLINPFQSCQQINDELKSIKDDQQYNKYQFADNQFLERKMSLLHYKQIDLKRISGDTIEEVLEENEENDDKHMIIRQEKRPHKNSITTNLNILEEIEENDDKNMIKFQHRRHMTISPNNQMTPKISPQNQISPKNQMTPRIQQIIITKTDSSFLENLNTKIQTKLTHFESYKNFQFYFPQNNIDQILSSFNNLQSLLLRKKSPKKKIQFSKLISSKSKQFKILKSSDEQSPDSSEIQSPTLGIDKNQFICLRPSGVAEKNYQ